MYKTDMFVKQHLREFFTYTIPLREERFVETIKSGRFSVYVQCDIEVPENLREALADFPPIFRNINVGRDDNDPFMKEYGEKEWL